MHMMVDKVSTRHILVRKLSLRNNCWWDERPPSSWRSSAANPASPPYTEATRPRLLIQPHLAVSDWRQLVCRVKVTAHLTSLNRRNYADEGPSRLQSTRSDPGHQS